MTDSKLDKYRNLRPTWYTMTKMLNFGNLLKVGTVPGGASFTSDGYWLILGLKPPPNVQTKLMTELPEHNLASHALSSKNGCQPPVPHLAVPADGKRFRQLEEDWVIMRMPEYDAIFSAYRMRWVERKCAKLYLRELGQWFLPIDPESYEPARYVVSGKIVALLMPFAGPRYYSIEERGLVCTGVKRYELRGGEAHD